MGVFRCFRVDGSWDNVETDHDTLAGLYDDLKDHGGVLGSILRTRPTDDRGVREVFGRRGVIISARAYARIEDSTMRFVEVEA